MFEELHNDTLHNLTFLFLINLNSLFINQLIMHLFGEMSVFVNLF